MSQVREQFCKKVSAFGAGTFHTLVVAVGLPSGAVEIITNSMLVPEKIAYYIDAYDDRFRLKANQNVQIIDFMLI